MRQDDAPTAEALLSGLLRATKTETMRRIYERLEPDDAGIIRTFANPAGTETARFSHSESFLDPSTNLANLPNKTALLDDLYRVRDVLIPHPGRVIVKADFSRAEARWCAWMAEDEARMQLYRDGIDEYRYFVAVMEWEDGARWEEVPSDKRNAIGKVGVLSGQYGVGWKTLMHNVNKDADLHGVAIDAKTAKRMEALIPEIYPETPRWWQRIREQVLTHGFIVGHYGRKRYFFGRTDSAHARDAVVREAIAFGPQNANAEKINIALARLYERFDPADLRLLLTVHDEIIADCAPGDVQRIARLMKNTMEFPDTVHGRELNIPVDVSATSKSWGEAEEIL